MFTAEHDNEGEYGSGRWIVTHPETGWQRVLTGKKASLFRLLIATQEYDLRPDVQLLELFTEESLERGRAEPGEPEVPLA